MNNIPWWRIDFNNDVSHHVAEAIRSRKIGMGDLSLELEAQLGKLLNRHVVLTTSGTSALILAVMATNIPVGSEVIVPDRTWIATAHAPLFLGHKVVVCPCYADRPLLDLEKVKSLITSDTKLIITVSLNGMFADTSGLLADYEHQGISILEDAAQAFLVKNKNVMTGTSTRFSTFSMGLTKLLPTGQGGFVSCGTLEDKNLLVRLRSHGLTDVNSGDPWEMPGLNFKFTDYQAAFALAQLPYLSDRIERLRNLYATYKSALAHIPEIQFYADNDASGNIPLYVEVLAQNREELVKSLTAFGIQTRVIYPNISSARYVTSGQKIEKDKRYKYATHALVLPSGPDQHLADIALVINAISNFYERKRT